MSSSEQATIWGVNRRTAIRTASTFVSLSVLMIAMETGFSGLLIGFLMATLPLPVYVSLGLWLDRFEAEPARLLVKTFAWGAIVALFLSMVINTTVGIVTGSDIIGSVISAPIAEETTKGLALLLLFYQQRDEFDNVTDGIIYALMVGLGFAMAENVLYYGRALAQGAASQTFVIRGVVSPFAHPLFTAMTGIGLGIARETQSRLVRVLAPLAGLAAAITLHALWNLSASVGLFNAAYLLIMVPCFVAVLRTVRRSLRREAELLREHLSAYVAAEVIPAARLDALCDSRTRLRASWTALRTGGLRAWREQRQYHQTASELAFHRWRAARGLETSREAFAVTEHAYAERLRALSMSSLAV